MSSFLSLHLVSNTDDNSNTTRPAQSRNNQSKWKSNVTTNCSNQSFTFYFFWKDNDNSKLVYCKICEQNLVGTHKKLYAYIYKSENTTSMINHLWEKHNVTRDNYKQYLDEHKKIRLLIHNVIGF